MITLPDTIDTLYVMIIDRSGSMGSIRNETILGINEYLDTQKSKGVKNAYVCLYQFDSSQSMRLEKTFDMIPLERTRPLGTDDYLPRGGTPLYEAIGEIVTEVRKVVDSAKNPPAVIVQILTDGANTDYYKWNENSVSELINTLEKEVGGWTFTYAGANHDANRVSSSLGISGGNTIQYATANVTETFSTMAAASSGYALMNSTLRSVDKSARHTSVDIYSDAGLSKDHLK